MPIIARIVVMAALTATAGEPAWAYVGPGAGLSLLGAFWTLLMAVFAATAFLVQWPVRRLLHRIRSTRSEPVKAAESRAPEMCQNIDPPPVH